MSAGGELGLSSGHRSELFKMTVPLNENSLTKWEGEVQHRLKNLPQELDQYVKACPQSTCGREIPTGGLHVHSGADIPLKYKGTTSEKCQSQTDSAVTNSRKV